MSFFDLSALRTILATETDADSPGSEELLSQIRENWEVFTMLVFDTGVSGTVTGISGAVLTDTGNFAGADVHNGHTLVITSGTAIGNTYTIDDSDTNTLTCTGDNLETDGVDVGDTYKVFYDLKVNTQGHDHDGVNSAEVVLADGQVVTAKLASDEQMTTANVDGAIAGSSVGAVGTYALLYGTGTYDPGDTASGGSLNYTDIAGTTGAHPSGTWRCMGKTGGVGSAYATLWLRIS